MTSFVPRLPRWLSFLALGARASVVSLVLSLVSLLGPIYYLVKTDPEGCLLVCLSTFYKIIGIAGFTDHSSRCSMTSANNSPCAREPARLFSPSLADRSSGNGRRAVLHPDRNSERTAGPGP